MREIRPSGLEGGGAVTPLSLPLSCEPHENYVQRMLEVLRKAPVLRLPGNQTVTLKNIRPPAKTLTLSAEAVVAQASSPASSAGVPARSSERAARTPPEPAGGDACATEQPVAI